MPLARVVTFDGVSSERMAEMQSEMEGSERPDNVPAKEIVVLHDPEAEKSLVVVFFDTEEDYKRGDEALSAMPAGDTPGKRTSVAKYQVAFRMTGLKQDPRGDGRGEKQPPALNDRRLPVARFHIRPFPNSGLDATPVALWELG